jgi:hypothetical protein
MFDVLMLETSYIIFIKELLARSQRKITKLNLLYSAYPPVGLFICNKTELAKQTFIKYDIRHLD